MMVLPVGSCPRFGYPTLGLGSYKRTAGCPSDRILMASGLASIFRTGTNDYFAFGQAPLAQAYDVVSPSRNKEIMRQAKGLLANYVQNSLCKARYPFGKDPI